MQELVPPVLTHGRAIHVAELREGRRDRVPGGRHGRPWVTVRPADRLGYDHVDHPELEQVLGGDLHADRSVLGLAGVVPQDRGRSFGRDHAVDGMLEHQHAIGRGDGDGTAGAAFADDHRYVRDAERQAGIGRACDRFRLATLLGTDTDDIVVAFYRDTDGMTVHLFDTVTTAADQQTLTVEGAATAVPAGAYRAILRVNNQQARSSPRLIFSRSNGTREPSFLMTLIVVSSGRS